MASNTTRSLIGSEDLALYDGVSETFARKTSTGGDLTLNKVGYEIDVAVAHGDGTASLTAITTAISAVGLDRTFVLRHGTWVISANLTIPANFHLRIAPGAILSVQTGVTLTINSSIEAGPYKIFSWTGTGTIDISGSPTRDCPLEWWGGVASAATDNSAALIKAAASMGNDQTLCLGKGVYGLLTATAINRTYGFHIKGMGQSATRVYINTPAAAGMTLGTAGTDKFNLSIKNLSFVGPASACTTGVILQRWHDIDLDNVNFYLGASGYALDIKGCLWVRGLVRVGRSYDSWTGYAVSANGIKIEGTTDPYQSNVVDLKAHIQQNNFTTGIWVDGTNVSSSVLKLNGSIENCVYPLVVNDCQSVDIANMYINDYNQSGPSFTNCTNVRMSMVESDNDTYSPITHFINTKSFSIDEAYLSALSIDGNCRRGKVGNLTLSLSTGLVDSAPDTIYTGSVNLRDSFPKLSFLTSMSDRCNLLTNMYLARWKNAAPVDWSDPPTNATWTKAGDTLADTTKHIAPYCIKSVTTGASAPGSYINLNSNQLEEVKGRTVNFTIWCKMSAAQTFTTYPYVYFAPTVPARVDSTDYVVNDAITISDANIYICKVAGTSAGSEPAFDTDIGDTTTDGTVTWVAALQNYVSTQTTPLAAADIGNWKKMLASCYVPKNATALSITVVQSQQTGGAESTAYWAEPCLMVGNQGPMGLVSGRSENLDYIQIGNITIRATSPPDGEWVTQGSIIINQTVAAGGSPGWSCTTAGTMSGTAVWKEMANVDA